MTRPEGSTADAGPGPPFRFEATYDAALVRRSAWCFARRRFMGDRRLWLAFWTGEFLCLGWAWWFDEGWAAAFAIGLPASMSALFVAVWRSHRAAAVLKMRALDASRASFTFDRDGITVASRILSTTMIWAALEEAWTYPDFWIVTLYVNGYFTIPTASAPPEALAFARARLDERPAPPE